MLPDILIIISAVVFLLILWLAIGARHLRLQRVSVEEAWRPIDDSLRKRHDLLPNLVETVRSYIDGQDKLLHRLINDRARAMRGYEVVEQKIENEHDLSEAINRVIDLGRTYRELSKDVNFLELRKDIDDMEKNIEKTSAEYNKLVRGYNRSIRRIWLRPLAAALRYKRANIFEFEL